MNKKVATLITTALLAALTLASCSAATPSPAAPDPAPAGPPASLPDQAEPSSDVNPVPVLAVTGAANEETSGEFWVQVFSLEDVTTDQPQYTVEGQAPVETVLSINEEILLVGADQRFSVTLGLDEGINLVEILATSPEGQEASFTLTVTYQPVS